LAVVPKATTIYAHKWPQMNKLSFTAEPIQFASELSEKLDVCCGPFFQPDLA